MDHTAIESRTGEELDTERHNVRRLRRYLLALTGLLATGLIVYSTTMGFVWDEGFHLLAAQLIHKGKTPYIDFCFPQPPLNAYLNAGLFSLFGVSWRVTHVIASLFLAASAYLAAEFVLLRFSVKRWIWPCALMAALFTGLNENRGAVWTHRAGVCDVDVLFSSRVSTSSCECPVRAAGLLLLLPGSGQVRRPAARC